MDKEYILIKKEDLQSLIENALKWNAIVECTELLGELKPKELDAIILEYCESTGISFPSDFCGRDALDVLIHLETEQYIGEMKNYDERKND